MKQTFLTIILIGPSIVGLTSIEVIRQPVCGHWFISSKYDLNTTQNTRCYFLQDFHLQWSLFVCTVYVTILILCKGNCYLKYKFLQFPVELINVKPIKRCTMEKEDCGLMPFRKHLFFLLFLFWRLVQSNI